MSDRIIVDFLVEEGAARRLLGLVEQRGFAVLTIEMRAQPCGRRALMTLDVAPRNAAKRSEVLVRQLERLHGVFSSCADTSEGSSFQ
jgi:acetolactate synthase regulatory subunit